jgi:hypothetical protein
MLIAGSKAQPDVEIHQSDEPAANRIQDCDRKRHLTQVQQIAEESCNSEKEEDAEIQRPESAERNRFVVLKFWAESLSTDLRKKERISTHDAREF